jgi:hypothetical protein
MITQTPSPRLEVSLERWQQAGLIDRAEAEAIRHFEDHLDDAPQHAERPARRIPVVSEALGYLGGMLGVIGLVLLVTRYWPDLGTPARLAFALGTAMLLTLAGAMVPHNGEPALERLRWFMWLGATAAAGLAGGVFADGVVKTANPSSVALAAASAVTALSGALWWMKERPVQQATFLVGLLVTTGTLGHLWFTDGINGVLVWVVAATMLAIGVLHAIPNPFITIGIGAAGTLVGAAMSAPHSQGDSLLFFVLTAFALLTLAGLDWLIGNRRERILLTVIGGVGMFQAAPQTVAWFARDAALATGLTVFAVGVSMMLLGRLPAVRPKLTLQVIGGGAVVVGAAITGAESAAFATTFGLLVAVVLIGLGTLPGNVLLSLFGCVGLLVNVPWAIGHFFPGQGRAPLLIAVSGVLIVAVAVWLSRQSRELHHQFARH